jgi:type I restriction-modification system DNA methylase subunit
MEILKIGDHRLMNEDLQFADITKLMNGRKASVLYSDPPWGIANLRYFQTINKRQTGKEPNPVDFKLFLDKFFDIIENHVSGLVFIEYGIRWRDEIKQRLLSTGIKYLALVPLQYGERGHQDLHIASYNDTAFLTEEYIAGIANTKGYTTLQKVIFPVAKKGEIIIDPCCGLGYTAQAAVDTGMIFYGNELNARKLKTTAARLNKGE